MQNGLKILLIEDNASFRSSVVELLGVYNDVSAVSDLASARSALGSQSFDVVLLDLTLPDGHGLSMLKEIKADHCTAAVLVLTGDGDFNTVKKCIEAGADDYVVKSERIIPDLLVRIPVAVSRGTKNRHAASLETQLNQIFKQELVGRSLAMAELREAVSSFAATDSAILITGESGTGKENIARRLHHMKGPERPFIPVNCGAIPENLVESQLFGHDKGSFTGAVKDQKGFFELAHKGDLFLDEVGELPLQAQVKLLRVLQEGHYFKVGGDRPIEAKCRVLAATNVDLEELVHRRKFRKDLFYRLNIIRIKTTPLRERREDIRDIANFLVLKWCGSGVGLSAAVMNTFERHDWPGNIRELENTIVRAKHLAQKRGSKLIDTSDILIDSSLSNQSSGPKLMEAAFPADESQLSAQHYQEYLVLAEREYLRAALNLLDGRAEMVAPRLGLHRSTLFKKISQLGLGKRSAGLRTEIEESSIDGRTTLKELS